MIKLLITGGKSSGKTVAACCAYRQLSKAKFEDNNMGDFGIIVREGVDVTELTNMYNGMLDNKLPEGSIENHIYDLILTRKMKNICNFLWLDYMGNMTTDFESSDIPEDELNVFDEFLNEAAILAFIIPGNVLDDFIHVIDKDNGMQNIERAKLTNAIGEKIGQVITLVNRANELNLKKYGKEDNRPIIFYVTKSDKVKCDDSKKMDYLYELLCGYNLLIEGRKILGCHSTIGKNLVLDEKTNKIIKGFDPVGFEIPVMLTVGYALSEEGRIWEKNEISKIDVRISELNNILFKQKLSEDKIKKNPLKRLAGILSSNKNLIEINNNIDSTQNAINEAQKTKNDLSNNNSLSQNSKAILEYLQSKNYEILYVNDEGKRCNLSEFFK